MHYVCIQWMSVFLYRNACMEMRNSKSSNGSFWFEVLSRASFIFILFLLVPVWSSFQGNFHKMCQPKLELDQWSIVYNKIAMDNTNGLEFGVWSFHFHRFQLGLSRILWEVFCGCKVIFMNSLITLFKSCCLFYYFAIIV